MSQEKLVIAMEIIKRSVEAFGTFFFKNHLSLKTPDFHKEIYNLYESKHNRIAIAAPRGHAKSTITDLVYLAWEIVNKNRNFVLIVSDTYSQAVMFLETLKAEFESNDKLIEYYGKLKTEKWSESEITVNGIRIKALGAGMKVRGLKYLEHRPDLIIVDDLENDELVESKERREKLERWVNGALIPSLDKNGRIIFIGTILHYDSILAKLVGKESYQEFIKKTYRALNNGIAIWPEHLNEEELSKIKDDYLQKGQGYLFYQEYQNDPVSGENRKFKIEKIKYYTEDLILNKRLATYITIDRAYSTVKTADSTGIIIVSVDNENYWYLRKAERFKGNEKEVIDKIFDLKSYYNPVKIGIEQKAFEYTLKPTLEDEMRRRDIFFGIDELKDRGKSKNLRIEGLLPRFESGTIFLLKNQTDLIDEMITFPFGIHDDLIDSLSYQLEIASSDADNTPHISDSNITYKRQ